MFSYYLFSIFHIIFNLQEAVVIAVHQLAAETDISKMNDILLYFHLSNFIESNT